MHGIDVHKALYLYCEIYGPWARAPTFGEDYVVKMYLILEYLLFYSHIYFRKTKRMYLMSTDLYLICKIHGLWDSSGPRAGAICPYSEYVFNKKKSPILYSYNTFDKKSIHCYDVHACPLLRFRNSWFRP